MSTAVTGVAWEAVAEVVVVGTGVAGLTCALDLAEAGKSVLIVTKAELAEGNTRWAQGGVAVATTASDVADHLQDTVDAGAGLTDRVASRAILAAGPGAVGRLIRRGARFDAVVPGLAAGGIADRTVLDDLMRTREGGHHVDRIIHAGGDATGAEIERALSQHDGLPRTLTHHMALDIQLSTDGPVAGLTVLGPDGRVGLVRSPVVVLATGGSSEVYASGTNPAVATGDGMGMALRAGVSLMDVEFVQFHPTALWSPTSAETARGRRPLVTEALRGAGATLLDSDGKSVMSGVHPLADLAPRDVVSLAITRRLAQLGTVRHVYLDARHIPPAEFGRRFPTVLAACQDLGIDAPVDLIPVSPAAHYQCGGVVATVEGRTSVPGLYAIGEVARTGLHGGNRLASNSLLEGLVMAEYAARDIIVEGRRLPGGLSIRQTDWIYPIYRGALQDTMTRHAGIGRTSAGLHFAAELVAEGLRSRSDAPPTRASVEATNLAQLSASILAAASRRTESRGCHVHLDYPDTHARGVSQQVSWVDERPVVADALTRELVGVAR